MTADGPLVDAESLLALTADLRTVRGRLEDADVSDEQRGRWQRTLASIAEGAAVDIERARGQLGRLTAQLDRTDGA